MTALLTLFCGGFRTDSERRCTVECYGHDIHMTQRDISYAAIPNLKATYHPGQELDCIVKSYNAKSDTLVIARYETEKKQIFGKILAKW